MNKKKFVIIDGNALLHRAFHALPPLTTKDGKLVNAVYGFALTLLKILKDLKPEYLAVAFDTKAPTFRDKAYEDYKAHRIKQPQELYDQIPLIKDMLQAFNIIAVEKDGFEADDVIGTLATQVVKHAPYPPPGRGVAGSESHKVIKSLEKQIEVIIVTGDLDALQLVNEHVRVYTFRKGFSDTVIFDAEAVKERYGLAPDQIIDYKALRGDPSDNIPGVRGIGEKTATELLTKFGTLENIYKTIEHHSSRHSERSEESPTNVGSHTREMLTPLAQHDKKVNDGIKPAILEKLKAGKKNALLSQMLATIKTDAPIEFALGDARVTHFDAARIVSLFQQWGFQSLAGKLAPLSHGNAVTEAPQEIKKTGVDAASAQASFAFGAAQTPITRDWSGVHYHLVGTPTLFDAFLKTLKDQKGFVIDTETTGLNPFSAKLLGISFSWNKGEAWYVDIRKPPHPLLYKEGTTGEVSLKEILEDPKIEKCGHNVKYDLEVLRHAGIHVQGYTFDTMIASYLLNPGSRQHGLDGAVFSEFGYQMQPITELIGKGKNQISLDNVPVAQVSNYSCEDADYTCRLVAPYRKRLQERDTIKLFKEIEMPLIPILADMEEVGILMDTVLLGTQAKSVRSTLKKLEAKIYRAAGQDFNINSPLQLKEILFEKLMISTAGLGKTKTGISTAAGELEKLKGKHPIIEFVMEYRELYKLLSTYLDALPAQVDPRTGRIHTDYQQTIAATGRLSSANPNLQNIPIRTELGREIRKTFVAERGYRLISADYSQIELRIAASLTGDAAMTTSFHRNEDIHRRTASNVLGVPYDEVTSEQRRRAKAINFGILYGLGARGLAAGSELSYEEAKDFIERYFRIHTGIKAYVDDTIERARTDGFVETLFGRRRYLPEITAEHQGIRAAAERMAINHPIQGTAADLIKKAMINIDQRLNKELGLFGMRPADRPARMLLQVHDELVLEVKSDLVDKVSTWVKWEMESVTKLKVPIEVHVGTGKNWDECK